MTTLRTGEERKKWKEEAEKMIKKERVEGILPYLKGREHMYHPALDDFQAALSPSLSLPLWYVFGRDISWNE